ncbi:MAG: hypothetical protein AAGH82_09935 [Pseudomonadota bacterium]
MKTERSPDMATRPGPRLREPATVMRLARMGSFHQTRLSFMRTLLRRIKRENWTFDRPIFDMDPAGVGVAVYAAHGPDQTYSLICFGHDLPDDQRSDRVIAHAWDATFALFKGVPEAHDIERLQRNVPKQEAGRVSQNEVCLSRANKSVRLFEHVASCLAAGQQPDQEKIDEVGYLLRTTAVYGSGKFGAADLPEGTLPFQTEMLTVFLIRAYALDLVEHVASARAPHMAVKLEPNVRRRFGVGNSTGLGMAPFIINHPVLLNNWIVARETALSRVRSLVAASETDVIAFKTFLTRAMLNVDNWRSKHPIQTEKIAALKADLEALKRHLADGALNVRYPWDKLHKWAETNLCLEGQEQLAALMLEPYGPLVDDLTETMGADEANSFNIDGSMDIAAAKQLLQTIYGWARQCDWSRPEQTARVWYVSEEKLEPRLGERAEEPIETYEQPLAPGRDAMGMLDAMKGWSAEDTLAEFLLQHPEHRHTARRAQIAARYPYAEIRDNTIAAQMLPIDLLRCKLSFFGATHFDPRSDRWVRITMFQNAPFPHEVAQDAEDDWSYPPMTQPEPPTAAHQPICTH